MELYNTDRDTGEYCGNISEAQLNPMYSEATHNLSDKYLYNPKKSSLVQPPDTVENEAVILSNGEWEVKSDHRAKVYYSTDTQERHDITEIGTEPNPLWTDIEPPSNSKWLEGAWVDDIELIRSLCLSALSVKRRAIINAGVSVDGVSLQSDDSSYSCMTGYVAESVIDGLIFIEWECPNGDWKNYTVQDLKPVYKEITNYRLACFIFSKGLSESIKIAADPTSIDIETGWPSNILTTV